MIKKNKQFLNTMITEKIAANIIVNKLQYKKKTAVAKEQ